jgi:hypothetical protein
MGPWWAHMQTQGHRVTYRPGPSTSGGQIQICYFICTVFYLMDGSLPKGRANLRLWMRTMSTMFGVKTAQDFITYYMYGTLQAPISSSCGGLVAFCHLLTPSVDHLCQSPDEFGGVTARTTGFLRFKFWRKDSLHLCSISRWSRAGKA